jgi:hypothetical protein
MTRQTLEHDQEKWIPVFRPITRQRKRDDHDHFWSIRPEVSVIEEIN